MTEKTAIKRAARARQQQHGGKYQAQHRLAGGGNERSPWICDVCHKAIAKGTGYVLIRDPETKAYPRRASEEPIFQKNERGWVELGSPIIRRDHVEFAALHSACDETKVSPYWFDVERAETHLDWLVWVHHLTEKRWMAVSDIRRMLAFWFRNRGLNIEALGS